MAHEFIAKKGLISQGNAKVSGSLVARDGIRGYLYDTASFAEKATSASFATFANFAATASYAFTSSYETEIEISSSWASESISASYSNVAAIANAISFVPVTSVSASWAPSSISSSFATTTSYIATASSAVTASYALGIPTIKSGIVGGASFQGNPKTAPIIFTTPFPNNNYSVTVTGESSRTWTIQNKVSGSFQINANNNTAFTNNVFWQAISTGEYYS